MNQKDLRQMSEVFHNFLSVQNFHNSARVRPSESTKNTQKKLKKFKKKVSMMRK